MTGEPNRNDQTRGSQAHREPASSQVHLTSIAFTLAPLLDVNRGLWGWVTCIVNNAFKLDGITLRQTSQSLLSLSWPARRDRTGQQHPYFRLLKNTDRQQLERAIFSALGLDPTKTGQRPPPNTTIPSGARSDS